MLIRSTLFSRLSYMSRENTDLGSQLQEVQKQTLQVNALCICLTSHGRSPRFINLGKKPLYNLSLKILQIWQHLTISGRKWVEPVIECVSRLKELALQGSNDTYSLDDLANMAEEVSNLKERLLNVANTEFNGRYVFSGTRYDTPPFDNTFTYVGTTTEVSIDVSTSAKAEVGLTAQMFFKVQ